MENKKSSPLLLACVLLAGFLLGQYVGSRDSKYYIETEIPVDIVKTVAHLTVTSDDFILIYSDAESDIAYYRYVGEHELYAAGDIVYLYDGSECTVTSVSMNGFTLKTSIVAVPGMSGMAVLDEQGNQIGCISSLLQNGELYCIWS